MNVFTLDSKMSDVEQKFPFSRSLLHKQFHVGGCSNCGFEPTESIAEVAQKHVKDAQAMVSCLNAGLLDMQKTEITVAEIKDLVAQFPRPDLMFIDVREPWEFEICKIPGSELLTENNMEEVFAKAKSIQNVVLYCHHGMRSLNAALYFKDHGLAQARSLKGGIDLFSQAIDNSIPRY